MEELEYVYVAEEVCTEEAEEMTKPNRQFYSVLDVFYYLYPNEYKYVCESIFPLCFTLQIYYEKKWTRAKNIYRNYCVIFNKDMEEWERGSNTCASIDNEMENQERRRERERERERRSKRESKY